MVRDTILFITILYTVVIVVYGGLGIVMSEGKPKSLKKSLSRITSAIILQVIAFTFYFAISLLEPYVSKFTAQTEFASLILVLIAILLALAIIGGAIFFFYKRQQQRRQRLIDEIRKHEGEFFEQIRQKLPMLES
jgi:uncharacterized membrane protein